MPGRLACQLFLIPGDKAGVHLVQLWRAVVSQSSMFKSNSTQLNSPATLLPLASVAAELSQAELS